MLLWRLPRWQMEERKVRERVVRTWRQQLPLPLPWTERLLSPPGCDVRLNDGHDTHGSYWHSRQRRKQWLHGEGGRTLR